MAASDEHTGLYPIRTVSEITGVNSVTLRAWERRYGIVQPHRTAKGHRLYTRHDIDRIKQVLRLLEQGVPISRAHTVLSQSLSVEPASAEPAQGPWALYQRRMIEAIAAFDEIRLEKIYHEAMSLYPVDIVTRLLLIPLLQELGERWQRSDSGVAEEHFFAVYLRNKLGARFHHREPQPGGDILLAACLPGEHHELGLLLFALAAHDRGFRLVLLGANMPLTELAGVAKTTGAHAVVLSASVLGDDETLRDGIPALVKDLDIPLFIGGAVSASYQSELQQAGAIPLGEDLLHGLNLIHQTLRKQINDFDNEEHS